VRKKDEGIVKVYVQKKKQTSKGGRKRKNVGVCDQRSKKGGLGGLSTEGRQQNSSKKGGKLKAQTSPLAKKSNLRRRRGASDIRGLMNSRARTRREELLTS